jgi:hypothetical protein
VVKATVVDGQRVEYFDPNANAASTAAAYGYIPSAMVQLLEPYRRKFA